MFTTNVAEKSSGELGTAWQRYSNADHQGWVLPWELSLKTEQGWEGEALCPDLHDHPHSSEMEFCKSLLRAVTTARSSAALPELLTGQDLGAEFALTVGESKYLSGRRERDFHRAWKGLSHSLSASAAEEKVRLPNSYLEPCQCIFKLKKKKEKDKKTQLTASPASHRRATCAAHSQGVPCKSSGCGKCPSLAAGAGICCNISLGARRAEEAAQLSHSNRAASRDVSRPNQGSVQGPGAGDD